MHTRMQSIHKSQNINVISLYSSQNNTYVEITLKNSNEQYEGYVDIVLSPCESWMTRYYLHGWQQARQYFNVFKYKDVLHTFQTVHPVSRIGGVLTRYYGSGQITLDNGRVIDNYPMFTIDEDMSNAFEKICKKYSELFHTPSAIKIQKYIRGYLSRRRYNIRRFRIIKEIKALPAGAIISSFVGGQDYREAFEKWHQININHE